MDTEVVTPSGKTLRRVATRRTTPKEDAEAKEVRLSLKFKQRIEENSKYLEDRNVKAFLAMIGKSEGGHYHAKYGWRSDRPELVFSDESTHPGFGYRKQSTASGLYQINHACWTEHGVKAQGLTDFSPRTQDLIAVETIRYRKALPDVLEGNLESAIDLLKAQEWVSFKNKKYSELRDWYIEAGGKVNQ